MIGALSSILRNKGGGIHAVAPDATVHDAIAKPMTYVGQKRSGAETGAND
jgi:hypothetical protein